MFTKLTCLLLALSYVVQAQEKRPVREYSSTFQFSLFPGISTNGIYSASYHNTVSFNLFGGLSAGNTLFELSPVTNVNLKRSNGIQLAGLANIVGANAFVNLTVSEERNLINVQDFESNFQGIQLAGMLNYVRDHAFGIQIAGLFNVVGGDSRGFQLAGIGNTAGKGTNGFSSGVQLAGLYNVSRESISGFQVSAIFNYTDGQLAGMQLGVINKARVMKGKHTLPPTQARALQLGLLNFSKEMDGVQIGLINFGGAALGTQIGLINFFKRYPTKEDVPKVTPIALLNFGSVGSVFRVYFNEMYPLNAEYTTGNVRNGTVTQSGMPYHDRFLIYNQNALIFGYHPGRDTWGYGFERILYNKHSMLPTDKRNRVHMLTYGLRFIRQNRTRQFDRAFNLTTRLHAEYGRKWKGLYLFAGFAVNHFLHDPDVETSAYKINSAVLKAGTLFNQRAGVWPGYTLGVQL